MADIVVLPVTVAARGAHAALVLGLSLGADDGRP
jgi:hypothetical protein